MTYLRCDSKRRVLPVVTFVLISYLFSGELVCARPQDILSSSSSDNDTKEIVAEKVEPINNSTLNDRYKSKLKQKQREIMYYYLKHFESNCLSGYSLNDLNQATNYSKLTLSKDVLRKMNKKNKKIAFYFKKIKTKIKDTSLKWLLVNDELWTSFKQIKSKRDFFSNHFKLLFMILLLKLFTIFKSIKLQHCPNFKMKNDLKFKNQNKVHNFLYECKNYDEIAFYTKRILDTSFDSFNTLENQKCKNMFNNLPHIREHHSKNYKKTRVKRNLENNSELTYTDFDKMSIEERNEYIDNFYKEKLIHNFLENSLPDLRNNVGDFLIPVPLDESQNAAAAAEKTIPSTKSPYFVVENTNSFVLPKPNVHISSSVEITTSSPNWNFQSTTEMFPVYLITNKPKPYKPTTIINSVQSQAVTDSNILLSSNSYLSSSINWIPSNAAESSNFQNTLHSQIYSSSTYRPPEQGNWQYIHPYDPGSSAILADKDPALQFPYDTPATPSPPHEPVFVEPIVISSVDQLPTNYPIPLENSSLGHNPMTVLVGSRPPEIVLLEDVTFQSVHTIYQDPEQETLNQAPGAVAEDPPVAAAVPAGAAAAPPVAAAPAGGGGGGGGAGGAAVLGTLLSAAAGPAAAIIGGAASAAAGGAATAVGAAGAGAGTGLGQEQSLGTALDSADSDDGFEEWYQELAESVTTIFSFRFIRQTLMALYSLVMPHISFMLTSGFTVIAFLFPWLYPHIVVPLVSLMSSFTSRFL